MAAEKKSKQRGSLLRTPELRIATSPDDAFGYTLGEPLAEESGLLAS
jgi:hypothetical protein